MGKPGDIPREVWDAARAALIDAGRNPDRDEEAVTITARAIMAERARWQPAATYFNAYCLDEAESAENCLEPAQHEAAKAFGAVVRGEA